MENNYRLKPALGTFKEAFTLEDENGKVVYEGKTVKFSLLGASTFEFVNHITNKTEEHKIGKPVTTEQGGGGLISALSKRSSFKYDGQKIWDYLHDQGIRINSNISGQKIGMSYDVTFKGEHLATVANSSPKGKSILTVDRYFDVSCEEKDLDLAFLTAFSIARTEQTFYN